MKRIGSFCLRRLLPVFLCALLAAAALPSAAQAAEGVADLQINITTTKIW